MRVSRSWAEYELIDTSCGEKLERWGKTLLIRPDPQIIWQTEKQSPLWSEADAYYHRSKSGGGSWEFFRKIPQSWKLSYLDLSFKISPTDFKHTGLFPEQAVNWDWMREKIGAAGRPVRVLNLFAYTGGASIACAAAGAFVCHVDASKGMVAWGKENAALSGIAPDKIRWIVDDCQKFVEREIRRESFYDAVILDPPSYGRGPGGEVWKLEDEIYPLLKLITGVLSENPLFVALNSYTTGLSASVMASLLSATVKAQRKGAVTSSEIGLPITSQDFYLPCGSTAIWENK